MNRIPHSTLLAAAIAIAAVHCRASLAGEEKQKVQISLEGIDSAGQKIPCPLQDTAVRADVSGYVARVNVIQRFKNPSNKPIEALYTFPLPADSAVDAMTMVVGKQRVVGIVKRKEEAKKVYDNAKKAGKVAALLDQERPNIFSQRVANIMPGQDVLIQIGYTNTLKYEDGVYEWSFPTVVGPRFTARGGYTVPGKRGSAAAAPAASSSPTESVERDPEKITPPIVPPGEHAGHTISLTVNLNAGVPLKEVNSVLHPIVVQRQGLTKAIVNLQDGAVLPNKDFILRYRAGGDSVETGVLTQTNDKGGHFTVIFQPPLKPTQGQIAKREMIYVVDQTGSQGGFPIEKSKETIRAALQRLNPGDTFNLIGFNTEVYPLFPKAQPVTQANIAKAQSYLSGMYGNGGTDILGSMAYVLKQPADPARLRVVAYFTDGYVGNDMQVVDYIHKNRGDSRVFPFGIGGSVNRFLIEEMAKEGRGNAQVVTLAEDGSEAAKTFIKRLQRPLLLNPRVEFGDLPVTEVYPKMLPDLFAEGPIVLHGRYTKAAKGFITVKGNFEGKPWSQKIPVDFPEVAKDNPAVPSLWARAKIATVQSRDWLGAQNGEPIADVKETIIKTAVDYHLMSQYTSFVAVLQEIVNPGGKQVTADTPVEMPDGVSYEGIFGAEGAKPAAGQMNYAMQPGQGFAARPGDPLIFVKAPQDAVNVIALLPSGEIKKLQWDNMRGGWQARFDIPGYVGSGKQIVTVIIVNGDGTRKRIKLSFEADIKAPLGQGSLRAEDGFWNLQVAAEEDTDRVEAFLPWGERTSLERTDSGFGLKVAVPTAWQNQRAKATLVLTDRAHNRTTIEVDLSE